ncbi:MAG: substrate-binding domain-containing protein [Candidatus Aminicenantes bacterium]|nr:substrate-binding domain-containing protein [Candidatus Aminicenantes bacterium]
MSTEAKRGTGNETMNAPTGPKTERGFSARRMRKPAAAVLLVSALAFLFLVIGRSARVPSPTTAEALKGTISLSGAWALYPMAVRWAEEFRKAHPGVRIDIQAGGAGKGIADALSGMVDIGMVSRDLHPQETARGAFALAVTKDAVVPTISGRNPFLKDLLRRGVKKSEFEAIFITGRARSWNDVLANGAKADIHVFTRSDACGAAETWAAFFRKKQEDLLGIAVYGDPGLADAVIRDPLAVGYNNINFAYDPATLKPVNGLVVIPVDGNGNGCVDAEEDFFGGRNEIIAAIERGAYPSPPARELYFVTKGRPSRPVVRRFLAWILKEGQKFVREAGYIPLASDTIESRRTLIGNRVLERDS